LFAARPRYHLHFTPTGSSWLNQIERWLQQLDEPYLAPPSGRNEPAPTTFATRTVRSGELLVMGDNRDLSFDSRAAKYGPVRISDVVGKYHWTYRHASSAAR
jgi:hypothetical protein